MNIILKIIFWLGCGTIGFLSAIYFHPLWKALLLDIPFCIIWLIPIGAIDLWLDSKKQLKH
jgi:hypothetical protein